MSEVPPSCSLTERSNQLPHVSGVAWSIFLLGILTVVLQSRHGAWHSYLATDALYAYYDRAMYVFKHGSLQGIPFNEYQPGAVFFFSALTPLFELSENREHFVLGLIAVNVLFLCLYATVLFSSFGPLSVGVLGLCLIVGGPLLLYRFELFCHLIFFGSFYLLGKRKYFASGFVLGVAALTKLYPVLFLPYWLILAWKQDKRIPLIQETMLGFTLGSLTVIASYVAVFNVPASEIYQSSAQHASKPVDLFSTSGIITSAVHYMKEGVPPPLSNNLIVGIADKALLVSKKLYLYCWIIPLSIVYLWVMRLVPRNGDVDPALIILLLGVFLFFGAQLTPQYLYWFVLFVPALFTRINIEIQLSLSYVLVTTCALLLMTQFLYPLLFSELITRFFEMGEQPYLFVLLVARNVLFACFIVACGRLIAIRGRGGLAKGLRTE